MFLSIRILKVLVILNSQVILRVYIRLFITDIMPSVKTKKTINYYLDLVGSFSTARFCFI